MVCFLTADLRTVKDFTVCRPSLKEIAHIRGLQELVPSYSETGLADVDQPIALDLLPNDAHATVEEQDGQFEPLGKGASFI
jgi:hypothetical protein